MLRPRQPIRRFDVFTEYHRLERLRHGMPADEAKGYRLWLAQVVAARKFSKWKGLENLDRQYQQEARAKQYPSSKWRRLSGKEQTDQHFDNGIIERMGRDFYERLFAQPHREPTSQEELPRHPGHDPPGLEALRA